MSTPLLTDIANNSQAYKGALRVDEEYSLVAPAANSTSHTVWLHEDTTIRHAQSHPLESHWSQEITQPLMSPPLWPIQPPAARRAAIIMRPVSRTLGLGVVAAFLTLSLLLLVALNSRVLYGRSSVESEVLARPMSVQPSPTHPPRVRPTPTRSVSGQPVGSRSGANKPNPTAVPTSAPTPTAQPTPMATPSPMPTATPSPAPTPTPQPTPTSTPAPEPTPTTQPTPAPSPSLPPSQSP